MPHFNKSTPKSHRTYVRMVLWQHTPPKLKGLLLHHKSILVPPKCRVRGSQIAHCVAYSKNVNPHFNYSAPNSRRTYVRMVLRQHTPPKLKRPLLHDKSIMVPPKVRVSDGEIVHGFAWSKKRQPSS
jgi:hypothetical protein